MYINYMICFTIAHTTIAMPMILQIMDKASRLFFFIFPSNILGIASHIIKPITIESIIVYFLNYKGQTHDGILHTAHICPLALTHKSLTIHFVYFVLYRLVLFSKFFLTNLSIAINATNNIASFLL